MHNLTTLMLLICWCPKPALHNTFLGIPCKMDFLYETCTGPIQLRQNGFSWQWAEAWRIINMEKNCREVWSLSCLIRIRSFYKRSACTSKEIRTGGEHTSPQLLSTLYAHSNQANQAIWMLPSYPIWQVNREGGNSCHFSSASTIKGCVAPCSWFHTLEHSINSLHLSSP